jgi:hypothetical protein
MKRILLLFVLLLPITVMAHEGHGTSGSELIHLFISHYYIAIGLAIALAGRAFYRNRLKSKN